MCWAWPRRLLLWAESCTGPEAITDRALLLSPTVSLQALVAQGRRHGWQFLPLARCGPREEVWGVATALGDGTRRQILETQTGTY